MQRLLSRYTLISSKLIMENPQENNLKIALIQLKVSIADVDLLRNNSLEHLDELDNIKENLQNAFTIISKVWEKS